MQHGSRVLSRCDISRAVRRASWVALTLPACVWGQSSDPENTGQEPQKPSMLAEVTVVGYRTRAATSATGVVTDIIDTPMSISAINTQFLSDTNSSQMMDAIGSLTGVTGQSNSGETPAQFAVRGYPVTPQVDGFDSLSYVSGLGSAVGIDRIEVLKGPSAVFNGNVQPGGNINVIYRKPSFTPSTFVEGEVGSWNYRSGEIFSTGRLGTDKLAYLIDGYAKDSKGWVDWTSRRERTLILGLTFKPLETLSFNFNFRDIDNKFQISTLPVSHEGFIGSGVPQYTYLDAWVAANFGPNEPPQTITVPQYLPGGVRYNVLGPQNYNNENYKFASTEVAFKPNDHIEIRDGFMYSHFTWDLLALLQSGTKVLGPDGRAGLVSNFEGGNEAGHGWENKLEAAFYFDTGPISHALLAGYRVSYTELDELKVWLGGPSIDSHGQPWNFFTDGPLLLQDQWDARLAVKPAPDVNQANAARTRTSAYYFAEQMSMFDDRIHALVGARYTKTVNEGLEVHDTTPQVGLVGKPFPQDSLFASTAIFANYSRSFTPSGLTQPGTTQVVPPAKGTGKEIGVKTAWLNGAVTSTISVFRDDLSNIATPDYSQQGQNGNLVNYNLGGVGRAQGLEAEVTWVPHQNMQFSANWTHLPVAKYLAYPGVPQEIGRRFPSTPTNAGNLTAKYTFDAGPLTGLYLGTWFHAQSETRGVLNSDWHYNVRIPGLVQATAFAGYQIAGFDMRLNVENLTGRSGYIMNNAFQPQSPRAYYLTLKYKL
jgi:iron complex outermembrane receptor protein